MRTLVVFSVFGLSLGWLAQARAAELSLESRARAAQRACLTGDPAKGVELLTDLYLDTRDPTHIFNQGRCFEMNRRYEDAIGRFREYLVKAKNLTKTERADTEKHIANCQSYIADAKLEGSQLPPPVRSSATPTKDTPVDTTKQLPHPSADKPGSRLRTAGLVTGSVGIAALAAGVILNLKVNSMSSDLEKQYNYSPATDSTRKDYKTAGWVSYGVGATCLAGGALLYYLGWRQGSSASLAPAMAPGMAGAAVGGTF